MKLFQKSALAVAIAAVPFLSVNAMEALDDATLSEMTGQAGVTIETTVDGTQGITIGSILYTDTAEGGSNDIGGGSVAILGNGSDPAIRLQGQVWDDANNTWKDGNSTTKQTIDVDASGNLITKTVAADGYKTVGTDNITAQKISVGQVLLQSSGQAGTANGAQLVSNLEMTMESGDSAAHILNLTDTGSRAAYESSDHALVGATISKGLDGAEGKGANMAIITQGKSRIANLNVDALDGAIAVRGLSYGGGTNGDELMDSTQVIWAVGGHSDDGGGVYIQGSDSTGTLTIGSLHIGGDLSATNGNTGNIGRIQISNINQAGSVTRIYGH